jgi:hypothetical protein
VLLLYNEKSFVSIEGINNGSKNENPGTEFKKIKG